MSDLKKEIGTRIKECRKAKHITQAELAKAIGVAEITVRQYEAGKYEPDIKKKVAIASVLKTPYGHLFTPSVATKLSADLAEVGTDAISRQSAIKVIERARAHIGHNMERAVGRVFLEMLDDVGLSISKLPTIQPKRGRWHYSDGKPATIGLSFGVICDQCGTESEYCTNFCGECGAEMREVTT